MIGFFILGICLLAAVLLAGKWFVNADPAKLAKLVRYVPAGILGAAALFLMVTGKFFAGVPLAALALSLIRGWRLPGLRFPTGAGPTSGQASNVETEYLRMTLSHDSGVMTGTVLRGAFAGQELGELTLDQLVALMSECTREDPGSAQLLETYLERTVGPDWRDQAQGGATGDAEDGRSSKWGGGASANTPMTSEEAREILGVPPGASSDEIKEAHRRLMLKVHPDQGGSTYLAAKINQAKDILLGV